MTKLEFYLFGAIAAIDVLLILGMGLVVALGL